MPKSNLKIVQRTAHDDLHNALNAEVEADNQLAYAETQFAMKYPGDTRIFALKQDWEPEKIAFNEDQSRLIELRSEAQTARNATIAARSRVTRLVPEQARRAELAVAIEKLKEAEPAATKMREAVARANAGVSDAERIHADAVKAVAAAVDEQARVYEQALEQGHPPGRDGSVQDARRQVDAAADELATARTAAAALWAKQDTATDNLKEARSAVQASVRKVIAIEVPRLLEEARAMQLELEAKRQVLFVLAEHATLAEEQLVTEYLEDQIFHFGRNGELPQEHTAAAPWLLTIDALSGNAAAEFPKG